MNMSSIKPQHTLSRLHLGCGESLSQLLPEPAVQTEKPAVTPIETTRPQPQPNTREEKQ